MDSNNDLEFYIKIIGAPGTIRRFGTANPTIVSRRLGGGSQPGNPVFALTDAIEFGPYVWHGGWPAFERLWEDLTRRWRTLTVRLEVLGPPQRDDPELWGPYGVTTITWKGGREVDFAFSDDPDDIEACQWTMQLSGPHADERLAAIVAEELTWDGLDTEEINAEATPDTGLPRTSTAADPGMEYELVVQERQDMADQDLNPLPLPEEFVQWQEECEDTALAAQENHECESVEATTTDSSSDEALPDDLPFL